MESPLTMGEAGDSFIEKSKPTEDICLNGDLSSDEPMDTSDSKAPEVIDSPKNCCEKVPSDKVPIVKDKDASDEDEEQAMDVDQSAEEIEDDDDDEVNDTSKLTEDKDDVATTKDDEDVEIIKSAVVVVAATKDEDIEDGITDEDERVAKESADDEDDDNHDSIASPVTPVLPAQNGTSTDINGTITLDDDDDKELNNSDDVVFVQNDTHAKENGDICSNSDVDEVIHISDKETVTPKKSQDGLINLMSPSKKKTKKMDRLSDPPRRSTRNLHKNKSYVEKDDDPDVEEVTPEDPLADPLRDDKENKKVKIVPASSTIVVSDTKRLVEIAANSKSTNNSSGGKKEPTLVIIDTNSILSGRGPVPVSHKSSPSLPASFSMMPVALPAQGVYPPNMRATITPIPMKQSVATPPAPVATPILPTLTDDMYVVEAPSFIVPYVYEKPPIKPFKDFVQKMHVEIEAQKKVIAEQKVKDEEKRKAEQAEIAAKVVEAKSIDDSDEENFKDDDEEKKVTVDKNDKEYKVADDDDEGESDTEQVKQMKESETKEKTITIDVPDKVTETPKPKSSSYFDNALGQFFINIGYGLVQEFVQTDLLKQTKRKQKSVGTAPETKLAITSLIKNLEYSKENNEPYKLEQKRCEFCSFKTESALAMAHHMETPHMRNYVYKCNFCPLEVRSPHDILFHMEAEHNTRGRLERAPAFHQCPSCSFEDNQKGKLSRHLVTCVKKFKPERNLEPPTDWEPPAKIPRVPRIKQQGLTATAATYQALTQAKGNYQLFTKLQAAASPQAFARGRGRPTLSNIGKLNSVRPQTPIIRTNMMYRPSTSGGSVLVPTTYQFGGNQIFQNSSGSKTSTSKVVQQPSISITPLPRQPASSSGSSSTTITKTAGAAGDTNSKATFVICEICDGYIKDLEQLRNHMQWIHKVKIHPKMIYNRPPLNCQKCQFRFFTDQGLERHLLGSHGLVTSSMQEAANKSKDAGRCPVCGRVYQWKLLNHVARDHNMTLKPAHLSYKCTVCTATFGMYKQFENHVYSAHSVVAKRVMDKKGSSTTTSSTSTSVTSTAVAAAAAQQRDSLLKPLKINDEITIIPQPAKSKSKSAASVAGTSSGDRGK